MFARLLEAFALQPLPLHFAGTAHGFGRLAGTPFRRFLVVTPQLHLAEHAFALHLLLERLQRLVDIVIADKNLHFDDVSCGSRPARDQSWTWVAIGTSPIAWAL